MEDYAIEGYKLLDRIGEGTYGDVYKAVSLVDKKVYAIKFIRFRETSLSNGVSLSTIREIRFLKSTDNKNIVKLFRIVSPDVNEYMKYSELKPICMVMDYVEHDMWGLLQLAKELKLAIYAPIHVKWYMFQILSALSYLHSNMILHRDLKTSNILVTNNHVVKLTDFGLARKLKYGGDQHYTTVVMTLWYRPPELLLGESHYGYEADIWSAGCIFGELLVGSPIFPTHSDNEVEELHVIFKSCGTPEDSYIIHLLQSKNIEMKMYPPNLKNYLIQRSKIIGTCNPSWITDEVMDLLLQMLQISPSKRKTADELLQHPYFDEVRNHTPDIPPFAESLNTHRFQVKSSRVQSTRSDGASNPPPRSGLGVFEQVADKRPASGLKLKIGAIAVPSGNAARGGVQRSALPSPFASAPNEEYPPQPPSPRQRSASHQRSPQQSSSQPSSNQSSQRPHEPSSQRPHEPSRHESSQRSRQRSPPRQESRQRSPSPYQRPRQRSPSPRQRSRQRSPSPRQRSRQRSPPRQESRHRSPFYESSRGDYRDRSSRRSSSLRRSERPRSPEHRTRRSPSSHRDQRYAAERDSRKAQWSRRSRSRSRSRNRSRNRSRSFDRRDDRRDDRRGNGPERYPRTADHRDNFGRDRFSRRTPSRRESH